jgi:hypothetical protein
MAYFSLCIDVHTRISDPERYVTGMFHAKKALGAAEDALGLLTFYNCPLLISPLSISYISRCALACLPTATLKPSQNIRDYVSFILGFLQQLSPVWTIASHAAQTLRDRARRTYAAKSISELSSCTTSGLPAEITQIDSLRM